MLAERKFRVDLLINMIGLAIVGFSGIYCNLVIAQLGGTEALGVFNQVFAAYILVSQISVFGIHNSVSRAIADETNDRVTVFWSAFQSVIFFGSIFSILFYLIAPLISQILDSPNIEVGVRFAAPGLFFFSLNKVFLAALNGLRLMRAYAVYNTSRYLLLLAAVLYILRAGYPSPYLLLALTVSELVLSIPLLLHLVFVLGAKGIQKVSREWHKAHFDFGLKSFMGGMLVELNTRVDVLMLGFFLGDKAVGVFSFAAALAEGFFQFLVVIRNNYNPILVREIAKGQFRELREIIFNGQKYTVGAFLLITAAAIAIYPIGIQIVGQGAELGDSYSVFVILMVGLLLHSPYAPFFQIIQSGGFPGWQTMGMMLIVVFNVIGNGVLIPLFGIKGAAMSTSMSYVVSNFILIGLCGYLFKRRLV
jgi:O-antigen/teichoic acid export membrane protein